MVSGSFHLPSRALFNVQSPYYYAIGLEEYLELEVSDSQFTREIRRTLLMDLWNHLPDVPLRDFHPLWWGVPATLQVDQDHVPEPTTPHLPMVSHRDSVCSMPLSIAFNHGISIDFFSCGY